MKYLIKLKAATMTFDLRFNAQYMLSIPRTDYTTFDIHVHELKSISTIVV